MPQRVYRFPELKIAGVPFTRKHVTALEKKGEFPQHFNITDFSVGWVADEVDKWVESKIRSRSVVRPAPYPSRSAPVRSGGTGERPRRRAAAAQA
jgi:predicted DNA-binding transcriptional regulator AlpA